MSSLADATEATLEADICVRSEDEPVGWCSARGLLVKRGCEGRQGSQVEIKIPVGQFCDKWDNSPSLEASNVELIV